LLNILKLTIIKPKNESFAKQISETRPARIPPWGCMRPNLKGIIRKKAGGCSSRPLYVEKPPGI
jgi:hypothetical protein